MKIESINSFTRHSRLGFCCLLLAFLLTGLTAGCSHQPWDIDTYIQNLERPERDDYQQPEKVVEALNIMPGMVVADVGAGSGYFTRRFAKTVGETGQVLAVDIEQKMLDYNKQELEKLGMANRAIFILAKPDDPLLSENSVDLVFLCNAYHHVEHHVDYWAKIKSALKPNGRLVIIDFYHDERSGKLSFSKHHLVPRERVIENMEKVGLTLSKEHTFLSRQYFLEFEKTK
ncbi:class I SAM-dependent methyltransferase [Candidatus Nitrospira allomarina]|uniref:Methyltransferase domain-containing protein n=1 Tax=Candidatus Nitrospira allomarina TaxID=3020900 RepID=A0AA96GFM0_9BACT|nr:methyltransferase domain-containing protein [Candidatus Nitrospira allomarina]WNM59195.1 methyltransferase domain-containing protein [Candidatus Nitrospira allomarina]